MGGPARVKAGTANFYVPTGGGYPERPAGRAQRGQPHGTTL